MIANRQQIRSFAATSTVTVQEQVLPVMQMSATYDDNRDSLNFNVSVNDFSLYEDHKAEVDADYDEFKEEVISELSK